MITQIDVSRKPTKSLAGSEAIALLERFPARTRAADWPATMESREGVIERLGQPPLLQRRGVQGTRMAGARALLLWLESFPGGTWQQRWEASSAESSVISWTEEATAWARGIGRHPSLSSIQSGLLALICADVIRPSLSWFVANPSIHLRRAIQESRDPEGFARVESVASPDILRARWGSTALTIIAQMIGSLGGKVEDITVGDLLLRLQLTNKDRTRPVRIAYGWLRELQQFPSNAPTTLRNIAVRSGQVSPEALVDRYHLRCRPVRDVLVAYLTERQPNVDYNTLKNLSSMLANNFWADIEEHHPEVGSLHLPREVASAWKERLAMKTVSRRRPDGTVTKVLQPRHNAVGIKSAVRAFYLDIAQWAMDEPEKWGPWAAPCPVREVECSSKKSDQRQKTQARQRTRERLPVLPTLVRVADQRLKETTVRLNALNNAALGSTFTVLGEDFSVPPGSGRSGRRPTRAWDTSGKLRYLDAEERRAFFAWAAIEILRHTGIRIEELLELGHHSIISYRIPGSNEVVPLLQIAPSKTDQERLASCYPRTRRRTQRRGGASPPSRRNDCCSSKLRRERARLE
ncbi:hypothetical protein OG535_40300 [Kitasatospora sp. NBC_00085]|uniref:hypothetical protein n=1 Tax=unclassified Kitasatospora TaxID=2633591 RepID=UPI00324C87CA